MYRITARGGGQHQKALYKHGTHKIDRTQWVTSTLWLKLGGGGGGIFGFISNKLALSNGKANQPITNLDL